MARKTPASPKPDLKVIPSRPTAGPRLPAHLGEVARQLWLAVTRDYAFEDPASAQILAEACTALDRAERCRAAISDDGEVVRGRGGLLRAHPLLQPELQSRALACRLLGKLGLDLEPLRAGPGRPPSNLVGLGPESLAALRGGVD